MNSEITLKRELFGKEIVIDRYTGFYSATAMVSGVNEYRRENDLPLFGLRQYLDTKSTQEFIEELNKKYGKALVVTMGSRGGTLVHPLLFIDIALAIDPKLKLEVYEWLLESIEKYRNDTSESSKRMYSLLWQRCSNLREFPALVDEVESYIKEKCEVLDWDSATPEQLLLRKKIHNSISTLTNVLTDCRQAVRLGVYEHVKGTPNSAALEKS